MKTTTAPSLVDHSKTLQNLQPGQGVKLVKILPLGTLMARREASGAITFKWRYTIVNAEGERDEGRPLIGVYDPAAPIRAVEPTRDGGFSILAAQRRAEQMAAQHHQLRDQGGRPVLEQAERERRRQRAVEKATAAKYTLTAMLDVYIADQKKLERSSWKDAEQIFKAHITDAHPQIALKAARDVTPADIVQLQRTLVEADKLRTAAKLRSYVGACYRRALDAPMSATAAGAYVEFGITINPVASTKPPAGANKADKNPLPLSELQVYWRALKATDGRIAALLRLHVATGGQRVQQLARLRNADIDHDHIALYDGKGRPGQAPRKHVIPLTQSAQAALEACRNTAGEFALSSDGESVPDHNHLRRAGQEIAAKAKLKGFTLKRVRSAVETALARAGVSEEHRGHLLSHGRQGVQQRNYNAYEFEAEKRDALLVLDKLLEDEPTPSKAKVVPLAPRRRA